MSRHNIFSSEIHLSERKKQPTVIYRFALRRAQKLGTNANALGINVGVFRTNVGVF